MDKTTLIKKYQKIKNLPDKGRLKDGGVIIGSEVDEDNRLHYVVKKDDQITIELAEKADVASIDLILKSEVNVN